MTAQAQDDDAELVIGRLNDFVTCGCGDDEWPQLRSDAVACIRRLSVTTPDTTVLVERLRARLSRVAQIIQSSNGDEELITMAYQEASRVE